MHDAKKQPEGKRPAIVIIGVGAGGICLIKHMAALDLHEAVLAVADTDLWAWGEDRLPENRIDLGVSCASTAFRRGIRKSGEAIKAGIGKADMVFVVANAEDDISSIATAFIAATAKENGALTLGVANSWLYPFESEEGRRRIEENMKEFLAATDGLIVIPAVGYHRAYQKWERRFFWTKNSNILCQTVRDLVLSLTAPSLINLEIADIRAAMLEGMEPGLAVVGNGIAAGACRAEEAAMRALACPLLGERSLKKARGVVLLFACATDPGLEELSAGAGLITEAVHEDSRIFFGTARDDSLGDAMRVTVIATGLDKDVFFLYPDGIFHISEY